MKTLLIIVCLTFFSGCGHFPADIAPNYSDFGFKNIEFDVTRNGVTTKSLGYADIAVSENEDLRDISISIYGLWKGTMRLYSQACSIDVTTTFNGVTTIKLSDLIHEPKLCDIQIAAMTDKLSKEHNIREIGDILVNVIPADQSQAVIQYWKASSGTTQVLHNFYGQGSLQRMEGVLTGFEKIYVKTSSKQGTILVESSCKHVAPLQKEYNEETVEIKMNELYRHPTFKEPSPNFGDNLVADVAYRSKGAVPFTSLTYKDDNCDFFIVVIPYDEAKSYMARLSVNVYGNQTQPLEEMAWQIKNVPLSSDKKLVVKGNTYILAVGVNMEIEIRDTIKTNYSYGQVYWIRGVTRNGRKSVVGIKDGSIFWRY